MPEKSRSVVITGTSTGIGRVTALELDRKGFRVFAGVRRESDAQSLRAEASERLTPLMLDVTDGEAVVQAAKNVAAELGDAGLDGLVNNAGIGVGGPIEFVDSDEWRTQFEVNVFGPAAVIRAFLPQVRQAKGRIVNVSSAAGRVVTPLLGPYCASKFALEALSDALRVEVRKQGVRVSLVEPGFIETPMLDKGDETTIEALKKLPPIGRELYGESLETFQKFMSSFRSRAAKPEAVARAIEHALTASNPNTRYTVGLDSKAFTLLAWLLPDRASDAIGGRLTGL
jgi:NAD(P)-dependent dehydrogenase (short-subunit alcohol dehydrogenase family)